jgi:hypothetical protein
MRDFLDKVLIFPQGARDFCLVFVASGVPPVPDI